jgi:hypothetical protein
MEILLINYANENHFEWAALKLSPNILAEGKFKWNANSSSKEFIYDVLEFGDVVFLPCY